MTKNKVKLSLIDDYVKIVLIKNFFDNSFDNLNLDEQVRNAIQQTRSLNCQLEDFYEKLITKLKLDDISFDILKHDLTQNNQLFLRQANQNFEHFPQIVGKTSSDIINIVKELAQKLKVLKVDMPLPMLANNWNV